MRVTRTQGAVLGLGALMLSLGGFVVVNNIAVVDVHTATSAPVIVQEPDPAPKRHPVICDSEQPPLYLANVRRTAKEGHWSFGSPATETSDYEALFRPITSKPSREAVHEELIARLCRDKALYAAITSIIDHKDPNRNISTSEWLSGIEYFADHGALADRATIEHRLKSTGYSLYMEPNHNKNNAPRIGASKPRSGSGWFYVLPFIGRDGTKVKLELRLDCGFQPRVLHRAQLPEALRSQV